MNPETATFGKKVEALEIKARRLSQQLLLGGYRSLLRGRGMTFHGVRAYEYGDEIRDIDWNVTARTGAPHVKIFEEERTLTIVLLVDGSDSTFFGSADPDRHRFIAELGAVLAFSTLERQDNIGLVVFGAGVETYLPPRRGKQQALQIIRTLLKMKPGGRQTDIGMVLKFARRMFRQPSVFLLLSDFFSRDFSTELKVLALRHEVVGLHIRDPLEESLPEVGLLCIRDPESGEIGWLDTADKEAMRRYSGCSRRFREDLRAMFGRSGADLISLRTTDDYVSTLVRFFNERITRK